MEKIGLFTQSSVKCIKNNTKNPPYRIRTTSLDANLILVNYLKEYPLFGSKFLDYLYWVKILDLFIYSKENKKSFNYKLIMDYVKQIKLKMNDKRTDFVWDH